MIVVQTIVLLLHLAYPMMVDLVLLHSPLLLVHSVVVAVVVVYVAPKLAILILVEDRRTMPEVFL